MSPADYDRLDGVALASMLRGGEISPFELMSIAVKLAQERAMPLNALCSQRFEESLKIAKTAHLTGPFGALPFLLKDSGLPSRHLPASLGSRLFRDTPFTFDGTLVERFEAAGFLSFARTTVPELCMAPTTEAVVYGGPTLNPWDPTRSPGGSSGGAAVAVALGVVPIAHGSDGGGSIRIPASCCGVFGLKPSRGLLPMGPARGEGWGGLATDGVITRTVRDTAAVLDAIKGPDPGAPYAAPPTPASYLASLDRPFDRPLRVAKWVSAWNDINVDPDCLAAVDRAEQLLVQNDHEVVEVNPPEIDFEGFVDSLINVIAANAVISVDTVVKSQRIDHWGRLLEPAILDAYQYGKALRATDYIAAIARFHQISRVMEQYMLGFDLVLTPTLTQLPVKLGTLSMNEDFRTFRLKAARFTMFLAIINASGQPAANVPLYWNEQGIPVGIQLIGRFGDEDTILRASAALERTSSWFRRYAQLITDD
ncbi:amidase [Metapseudomonas boanensis]|uniref:Amidase n=1 Tax=Metapseudomonas boanensis TaxID=2822138 RepID=A0ABS5XH42_9GAMM|nr:amidase [Pseudomonas boanensis]MBT8767005.1 amidase [Pseudomonas boanensis]